MEKNRPRLSIIIPAYNVESYISKCLDSCLTQDIPHHDYEIIIVDDGSTDGTAEVVNGYQKRYPNINYIYQENAGQGAARNRGINQSIGKYIWFVDSDDWVKPNCLGSLLDHVERHNLDLCLFPMAKVTDEIHFIEDEFTSMIQVAYTLDEFASLGKITYSPCNYIFHSRLVINHDVRFLTGIYHEDVEFNTRLLLYAQRIGHFDQVGPLYFYLYKREGSTMNEQSRSHTEKRIYSLFIVLDSIEKTMIRAEGAYQDFLSYWHNTIFKSQIIPLFDNFPRQEAGQIYRKYMATYNFDYTSKEKPLSSNSILSKCRHSLTLTRLAMRLLDDLHRIKITARKNKP